MASDRRPVPRTRLADRPSINNVARHMFKTYDGDGNRVYCVSCNRVLTASIGLLDSHFETCRRIVYTPSAATVFRCGPCNLTVKDFDHWKRSHVVSQRHRVQCGGRKLYTRTCGPPCNTILYGTVNTIGQHHRRNPHRVVKITDNLDLIPNMSLFMSRVYEARLVESAAADRIQCCAGCGVWADCMCSGGGGGGNTGLDTFYCDVCRVTFVCDESAYEWHLSSTEHLALHTAARSSRTACRLAVQTTVICSCPACERYSGNRSAMERIEPSCTSRRRPNEPPPHGTDYRAFRCGACSKTSHDVRSWTDHVQCASHPDVSRGRHYECTECRVLYFGTWSRTAVCGTAARHRLQPVAAADPMHYVYRELRNAGRGSVTFFYRQATGTFGRCDRSAEPGSVPHYCTGCRLEFYGDAAAYRQHVVTVQHLLLQLDGAAVVSPPPPVVAAATSALETATLDHVAVAGLEHGDATGSADDAYGKYVAARLKTIQDQTLKTNVKLAIESLFELSAR